MTAGLPIELIQRSNQLHSFVCFLCLHPRSPGDSPSPSPALGIAETGSYCGCCFDSYSPRQWPVRHEHGRRRHCPMRRVATESRGAISSHPYPSSRNTANENQCCFCCGCRSAVTRFRPANSKNHHSVASRAYCTVWHLDQWPRLAPEWPPLDPRPKSWVTPRPSTLEDDVLANHTGIRPTTPPIYQHSLAGASNVGR